MLAKFGLLRRSCYCGLSQLKTTCKLFSNHPCSSYRAGLASSDFLGALSDRVLICDFLLYPTSCVARTAPPICGAALRCRRRAGADVPGAREKPLFPCSCSCIALCLFLYSPASVAASRPRAIHARDGHSVREGCSSYSRTAARTL